MKKVVLYKFTLLYLIFILLLLIVVSINPMKVNAENVIQSNRRIGNHKGVMAYIAPAISIDTADLTTSKIITIKYQNGYKGEYSLDLGKTWLEYKKPITVSENTTVFARTIDNDGNVVRIASFTITSIRFEAKETIEPIEDPNKKEIDDESGGEVINPEEGEADE